MLLAAATKIKTTESNDISFSKIIIGAAVITGASFLLYNTYKSFKLKYPYIKHTSQPDVMNESHKQFCSICSSSCIICPFEHIGKNTQNKQTKLDEQNKQTELDEQNKQTELDEQNEQTELAEQNEQIELDEQNEQTELDEQNEQTELDEQNEQTELDKQDEQNEQTELAEQNEQIELDEQNEQTELDEQNEQTELDEQNEQTELDNQDGQTELDKQDEQTELNKQNEQTELDKQNEQNVHSYQIVEDLDNQIILIKVSSVYYKTDVMAKHIKEKLESTGFECELLIGGWVLAKGILQEVKKLEANESYQVIRCRI